MCGTPEEFLAAFRRYVDRQGLFVPTAAPIAAGLRGRFAVTLIDGSILIEGVAEVVSSSPRPSALYGRTGMVLAFAEVDEPSRETLTTLDKAKLSLKAQNLGAHLVPRPGTLREPVTHPEVKLPSAASDRVLALAECVVLGEVSALESVVGRRAPTAKPIGAQVSSRLPQRFAIPQIQAAAPPRAESERPVKERTDLSGRIVSDLPGDATEVGPIVAVEEGISQPSGPTLTSPVLVPPQRRSAPLIEPELESTLGGLPPVAPISRASTSQSGPAVARTSTSQSGPAMVPIARASTSQSGPIAPVAPASGPVMSRTSTNQSGPVPPVNAAPSRPSQRAIVAPRAGTDSTLRSPADAATDPSGPVERHTQLPAIPRTLTPIPVPAAPRAAAPAPSAPTVSRAPTPHPLAPAIPRTLTPAMALRQDASGANKAPRGSTESGFGSVPMRMPDRPSQATIRKTSIGISAVHIEPAPSEPAPPPPSPRPADAAVPQLIHDSMFATEDATDDGDADAAGAAELAQSAVPLPADQQATRREGLGARSLPRAAPSRASAPSLPGLTADQGASSAERLRPPPPEDVAMPSVPHGTPPPHEAPRLGRSSAPLEVPIEVDVQLDDPLIEDAAANEDDLQTELSPSLPESEQAAAPFPATRPSQPTVPIRPPAELAALAAKPVEPLGAAPPRRDSVRALPGVSPSELSASAPLAVEDASFATVPTTAPHLPGAPPPLEATLAEDGPPQRKSQPAMPPLRRSQQAISFGEPAAVASFSDPGSVSAPLPAVSVERPPLVAEAGAPALEAAVEHSARHAPPPAPAAPAGPGVKIEIDPALYAESAIDRSFEHNFVMPGAEQRPWQDVPTPWNSPASAPVVAPVQPDAPYDYQPYPGYDPSYPVSISSGDETALVAAPDVHRSRTLVIIGSAILVLLAGLAGYLYWDRQQTKRASPTPSELPSHIGDPQHATEGSEAPGSAAPNAGSDAAMPTGEAAAGDSDGSSAAPAGATAPSGSDAKAAPTSEAPGSDDVTTARPSDAAEPSCTVTFHSTPAGAAVVLDGKELGVTPLTKAVPCKGGELTFRKGSAAPVVQRPDAFTDGQKIEAKLTEVATKGKIEITVVTTPVAARIRLNNKEIGRSPVTIEVPAGVPIVLSAQKDGRAASVRVTPNERATSFTLDLKRAVRSPRKTSGGGPGLDEI